MFSLGPRCARRLWRPPRRCISSSAPTFADAVPVLPKRSSEADDEGEESKEGKSFKAFLKQNERLKFAQPRNWLGIKTLPRPDLVVRNETNQDPDAGEETQVEVIHYPFPLNPSFKPPAPISDAIRSRMYTDYMLDPETNSVRALSQKYHISLKRVEAILRLKGLEEAYVKNKPLQTGFLWGMEMLLDVKSPKFSATDPSPTADSDRADVHTADMLEQEENRDAARQRFQRQYWESYVDDGKEPILPASLEHAKQNAQRSAQAAHDNKSNAHLMPRFKDTDTVKSPRQKIQKIVREGRLPIHFVDVGGKFLEVEERVRRIAEAERRHSIRTRRSEDKMLKGYLKGRTALERAQRASFKRSTPRSTS